MPSDPFDELLELISSLLRVYRARLTDDQLLCHDLGVAGWDGERLLVAIADRFNIDMSEVCSDRYFGEEIAYNPIFHLWQFLQGRRLDEDLVPLRIADLKKTVAAGKWIEPEH